jgi:hypothetical protein
VPLRREAPARGRGRRPPPSPSKTDRGGMPGSRRKASRCSIARQPEAMSAPIMSKRRSRWSTRAQGPSRTRIGLRSCRSTIGCCPSRPRRWSRSTERSHSARSTRSGACASSSPCPIGTGFPTTLSTPRLSATSSSGAATSRRRAVTFRRRTTWPETTPSGASWKRGWRSARRAAQGWCRLRARRPARKTTPALVARVPVRAPRAPQRILCTE